MNILVIVTADSYVRSAVMITKDLHLTEARFGFWGNFYSAIIIENLCKKYCINNKNALIFTLEKELIEKYDQIILAVGNSYVNKFFSFLYNNFQKKTNRPIIISIFAGAIFEDTNSILCRLNSDYLFVNSAKDLIKAKALKKETASRCEIISYGFSTLKDQKAESCLKNTICFIDQVKFPKTKTERVYVLKCLIRLAKLYPNFKIILIKRGRIGEKTVHKNSIPYDRLLKTFKTIPSNFSIQAADIESSIQNMRLCISLSSTVLFEAWMNGISGVAIKDFGIRDEYYTSQFLGSGILVNFKEIDPNITYLPNAKWLQRYAYFDKKIKIKAWNTVLECQCPRDPINPPLTFAYQSELEKKRLTLIVKFRSIFASTIRKLNAIFNLQEN